jgi:hypothetical protein
MMQGHATRRRGFTCAGGAAAHGGMLMVGQQHWVGTNYTRLVCFWSDDGIESELVQITLAWQRWVQLGTNYICLQVLTPSWGGTSGCKAAGMRKSCCCLWCTSSCHRSFKQSTKCQKNENTVWLKCTKSPIKKGGSHLKDPASFPPSCPCSHVSPNLQRVI